jgi:hypothetical protein
MKRKLWLPTLVVGVVLWLWVGSYVVLRALGTHSFPPTPASGGYPASPGTTGVLISVPRPWEKTCRVIYSPLVHLDARFTGSRINATWDPAFCHGGKGG